MHDFFLAKNSGDIVFSRLTSIISLSKTLVTARGKTGRGGRSSSRGNRQNTSNRGFAAMDPKKQRQIARKGGRSSHAGGRSHTRAR
jgi:stress-induced acidophilic repeat protein